MWEFEEGGGEKRARISEFPNFEGVYSVDMTQTLNSAPVGHLKFSDFRLLLRSS